MIMKNIFEGKDCFIKIVEDISKEFDILKFCEAYKNKYPYLLESSAKGNSLARYSILFFKPTRVLEKRKENSNQSFLKNLDELFLREKLNQKLPNTKQKLNLPFLGGWFVYLGYELVKEIETTLKIPESPFSIPTAFVDRVSSSIIFDKLKEELYFVSDRSKNDILEMLSDYKNIIYEESSIKKKYERKKKSKTKIKLLKKDSSLKHKIGVEKCIVETQNQHGKFRQRTGKT